jgi:hypothetical protein
MRCDHHAILSEDHVGEIGNVQLTFTAVVVVRPTIIVEARRDPVGVAPEHLPVTLCCVLKIAEKVGHVLVRADLIVPSAYTHVAPRLLLA